jgi:hypothetical protein
MADTFHWDAIDRMVEVGYRYTLESLQAWEDAGRPTTSRWSERGRDSLDRYPVGVDTSVSFWEQPRDGCHHRVGERHQGRVGCLGRGLHPRFADPDTHRGVMPVAPCSPQQLLSPHCHRNDGAWAPAAIYATPVWPRSKAPFWLTLPSGL